MTRTRNHKPSFAREVTAIIKAGLYPRIERMPDGRVILTALPADAIAAEDEGERLDRLMDEMIGTPPELGLPPKRSPRRGR